MGFRSKYWSCTEFADKIRGTAKPHAGTSDEWHEWGVRAKSAHSIRYWIAEELLDTLQNFVTWPVRKIYNVKYYVNNRWVTRTHALTSHPRDIKPGTWSDVGHRFLPCMFNELVDYVEVEMAWWRIAWDNEAHDEYDAPFYASGWFRWRTWRSAKAGLDSLKDRACEIATEDWGLSIDDENYGKPTSGAIAALEILKLYEWWTKERPARPDPYEASGWTECCEKARELNDGRLFGSKTTPELKKLTNKAHKVLQKMEEQYEKEDEQMMIRLIKIRHNLWT